MAWLIEKETGHKLGAQLVPKSLTIGFEEINLSGT
jgi:hypothetical protein